MTYNHNIKFSNRIAISMTATTQKLTLAEYLQYDDGTDTVYELVEGE